MGKRIVIASGYFDPLHIGHLEYLLQAKSLGDELWVIVNNDEQANLKKGKPFMSAEDRSAIVAALACVDGVVVSIDEDASVCRTLENMASACQEGDTIIFAKGGDRLATEIPESGICRKMNIKVVDGLGEKIRHSSELIKGAMGELRLENEKLKQDSAHTIRLAQDIEAKWPKIKDADEKLRMISLILDDIGAPTTAFGGEGDAEVPINILDRVRWLQKEFVKKVPKQYSFRTRDGFELHETVECSNSHEYPSLALLELPCKRTLYIRHIPQEGGDVLIDIHTQDTDWDSVTLEKKEHSNGVQLRLGYDFTELTDMTDYIESLDDKKFEENSIHTLLVPADGHPKGTKVIFKGMHNGNHMAIVSPVGEPDSQSLFCVPLEELK